MDEKKLLIKVFKYVFLFLILILSLFGAINFQDIKKSIGIATLVIVIVGFFANLGFGEGIKYFFVSFIKALGYALFVCLGTAILVYLFIKLGLIKI